MFPSDFDASIYVTHPSNPDLINVSTLDALPHFQAHGMREGRICSLIDGRTAFFKLIPSKASLLEVGPFCSPCFRQPAHRVSYLDALSTEALRERAKGIPTADPASVPQIDYVWNGEPYKQLVNREFDFVFSAHNIEHQPCLITHLRDVASILRPNGAFFLAIPDKRYCFDHFLPESTIADVLDAHIAGRKTHSVRSVLEHWFLTAHNEPGRYWAGDCGTNPMSVMRDQATLDRIKSALATLSSPHGYIDVHAWQFSPLNFRIIIDTLHSLGLVPLRTERVYNTLSGSSEFFAILVKD